MTKRQTAADKRSITKQANEYLQGLEEEIEQYKDTVGEIDYRETPSYKENKEDMVIHRSDDHFGEVVKDENGEVIYDSDIAEARAFEAYNKAMRVASNKDIQGVHLLLGGDHVTNESIYEEQPHHIDEFIDEQMTRVTAVYDEIIENLADDFEYVQVVCQSGNHGEFRADGASKRANADDLLYDRLKMLAEKADYDNVKVVTSEKSDFTNFEMRDHKAHLRHGDNVRNHIGTSSPKSDWEAFLYEYDFDIAYRGHFHTFKVEQIHGKPVVMAPSAKPSGDYEGRHANFGGPKAYVHGVDDDQSLTWMEIFDLEAEGLK